MDDMGLWPFLEFYCPFTQPTICTGLLHCARGHPPGHRRQPYRLEYHDRNKLSGDFCVSLLLHIPSDQLYSQGLVHFYWCKCLLSCAQANKPNTLYLVLFFLAFCLHRLYGLFDVDSASYVRLPCVTIILQKQGAQGIFAESPFGIKRRLFLQLQWAYG
jgi:hypothetical protein